MARLIFSYFAEDTGVFVESGLFTRTVTRMSSHDSSNTHKVIGTLFRAMDTRHEERDEAGGVARWAMPFPYVNGVIDEAIERIRDGTITRYYYDPDSASLVPEPS